jgi:hypothetical protein
MIPLDRCGHGLLAAVQAKNEKGNAGQSMCAFFSLFPASGDPKIRRRFSGRKLNAADRGAEDLLRDSIWLTNQINSYLWLVCGFLLFKYKQFTTQKARKLSIFWFRGRMPLTQLIFLLFYQEALYFYLFH